MKDLTPEQWSTFLKGQRETGMGYFTGDITLRDGRIFVDAVFTEGGITEIRGLADIPFDVAEIADIRLTHKRWKWSRA